MCVTRYCHILGFLYCIAVYISNFECRQYHLKGTVQNYPSWGHKGRVVGELPQGWRGVQGRLHGMRGTRGSPGPAGCPDHKVIYQATRVKLDKKLLLIIFGLFSISQK